MSSAVQPGDVLLGKYRVERVLGQGGMGIVLAARHVQLGELFAIKMLLPKATEHPDAIERFLREARASAKLKGEHVARVHDVGSLENGLPYMVMEHLDGEDLKKVVKSRGGLPVDEAALYAYQACEAVAEAHANGIVHRDLKPANLFLIRRPNGTPCVKVLDFGISKELDPTTRGGHDLTSTGAFLGSPNYMSPEQMGDIKSADTRTDIWALGVILYEFIVGKVPFAGQAVTELVAKVLTTTPVPPTQVRPDVPPAFEAIILKCLEKRPEHRYQSVQELMAHLLPYAQVVAPPLSAMRASAPSVHAFPIGSGQAIAAPAPKPVKQTKTLVMGAPLPISNTDPSTPLPHATSAAPSTTAAPEGVTAGAWGQTSGIAGARDKKPFLLGALACVAVLSIGGIIAVVRSMIDQPASPVVAAASAMPVGLPNPSAIQPIQEPVPEVVPVPTNGPGVGASPAETAKPEGTTAQPKSTTKTAGTTAPGKPATTTKKPSIADFND